MPTPDRDPLQDPTGLVGGLNPANAEVLQAAGMNAPAQQPIPQAEQPIVQPRAKAHQRLTHDDVDFIQRLKIMVGNAQARMQGQNPAVAQQPQSGGGGGGGQPASAPAQTPPPSAYDRMSLFEKMTPGARARADLQDEEVARRARFAKRLQDMQNKVPAAVQQKLRAAQDAQAAGPDVDPLTGRPIVQ